MCRSPQGGDDAIDTGDGLLPVEPARRTVGRRSARDRAGSKYDPSRAPAPADFILHGVETSLWKNAGVGEVVARINNDRPIKYL